MHGTFPIRPDGGDRIPARALNNPGAASASTSTPVVGRATSPGDDPRTKAYTDA